MGAGLYGLNGLSPETAINMVTTYIIPAIMHGLETLRLSTSDYSMLAMFHQNLLRSHTAPLPIHSRPCPLPDDGKSPTQGNHHTNVLTLFINIDKKGGCSREGGPTTPAGNGGYGFP